MHTYISHLARTSIVYFKDDPLMGDFFIFIFSPSDHFSKVLMKMNVLKLSHPSINTTTKYCYRPQTKFGAR